VRLTLGRRQDAELLGVAEDGCGIPAGRMRQALLDGHIGLAAVSERVAALGGTLSINSEHDAGTSIRVRLPVAAESSELPARRLPGDISDRVTARDTLRVSPSRA